MSNDAAKTAVPLHNVLVTGTPGTGKSALSRRLAEALGWRHVDVSALIKEHRFYTQYDEAADTCDVEEEDEERLLDHLETVVGGGNVVVDYHASDLFPKRWFALVVVLRAETSVLFDRLTARGYSEAKRGENVEAEIMDVCEEEALGAYDADRVLVRPSNTTAQADETLALVVERLGRAASSEAGSPAKKKATANGKNSAPAPAPTTTASPAADRVTCYAQSLDGDLHVAGTASGVTVVMRASGGQCHSLYTGRHHAVAVRSVALPRTPQPSLVASGGADGAIAVVALADAFHAADASTSDAGSVCGAVSRGAHTMPVTAMRFDASNDARLVSAGLDGRVVVHAVSLGSAGATLRIVKVLTVPFPVLALAPVLPGDGGVFVASGLGVAWVDVFNSFREGTGGIRVAAPVTVLPLPKIAAASSATTEDQTLLYPQITVDAVAQGVRRDGTAKIRVAAVPLAEYTAACDRNAPPTATATVVYDLDDVLLLAASGRLALAEASVDAAVATNTFTGAAACAEPVRSALLAAAAQALAEDGAVDGALSKRQRQVRAKRERDDGEQLADAALAAAGVVWPVPAAALPHYPATATAAGPSAPRGGCALPLRYTCVLNSAAVVCGAASPATLVDDANGAALDTPADVRKASADLERAKAAHAAAQKALDTAVATVKSETAKGNTAQPSAADTSSPKASRGAKKGKGKSPASAPAPTATTPAAAPADASPSSPASRTSKRKVVRLTD